MGKRSDFERRERDFYSTWDKRAEEWRPIACFPGYEVSSKGRVRSLDREIETRNGQLRRYKGKLLSLSYAHGGYGQLNLKREGKSVAARVHVLVAEAFIGPRPEGCYVCHNDGNPRNSSVENIRYDTPTGNSADKFLHETNLAGENHPNAKLNLEDVSEIRKQLKDGQLQSHIAKRFGVTRATIGAISVGRSWRGSV